MEDRGYYTDPERYQAEYAAFTADQDWYLRRAKELGPPVLELGCGTGRILFALAREGLAVDGIDSSEAMLNFVRSQAVLFPPPLASRIGIHLADLRSFSLGKRYRALLAPLNTLMHLHTDGELLACLGCVRRHLLPGGRFLFDVTNPLPELLQETGGDEGVPLRRFRVRGTWYLQRERHRYDPVTRISETTFLFEPLRGEELPFSTTLRLRQYPPSEIDEMLSCTGFTGIQRFGGFDGSPFDGAGVTQVIEASGPEHSPATVV